MPILDPRDRRPPLDRCQGRFSSLRCGDSTLTPALHGDRPGKDPGMGQQRRRRPLDPTRDVTAAPEGATRALTMSNPNAPLGSRSTFRLAIRSSRNSPPCW